MPTRHDDTECAQPDSMVIPGKLSDLFYFAYGSNMNTALMLTRCAKPVAAGVARLPQHRIAFHGYSSTWDGAVESCVSAPGRDLWGVLYKLTPSDGDRLDSWLDVRLDGTGTYFHYPARVMDGQGTTHTVLLYKKDVLGEPRMPSREYLDVIVRGAEEHGLPARYIDGLRRIESKPAAFEVPVRGKYDRGLLLASLCGECGN
jgi:cation transport regulator ChaC